MGEGGLYFENKTRKLFSKPNDSLKADALLRAYVPCKLR